MAKREIQQSVREWLENSNSMFETNQLVEKIGFPSISVDFLVVNPYPFVVQIISFPLRTRKSEMIRQLLAQRILIAETFSPYLPIVLVGPNSEVFLNSQDVQLADAHFTVDQLPNINELPRLVNLNLSIQDLFAKGSPNNVEITEEETIGNLWSTSLSVRDFTAQKEYLPGTLAENITEYVEARQQEIQSVENLDVFTQWMPQFEHLVNQYLTTTLQGQALPIDENISIAQDHLLMIRFQGKIWQSPTGKRVYVKTFRFAGDEPSPLQALELLCDAWLLRARELVTDGGLILLLHPFTKKVVTFTGEHKSITTIDPVSVNSFQSAGWKVFPWDFDQESPAFIEYLRKWSKNP